MTDERLRTALHAELDSLPLPERFSSPSDLVLKAPAPRRRLTWMLSATAAAAALAVVLGVSPVGASIARAVTGWFIADVHVRVEPNPSPPPVKLLEALQSLQPGQTLREPPEPSPISHHQVFQAQTFAELQAGSTAWPLPALLPPGPETKVIVSRSYWGERELSTALQINYNVQLGQKEHWIFYYYSPTSARAKEPDASLSQAGYVVAHDVDDVRKQKITLKGQEGTAVSTDGGKSWRIHWFSAAGLGFMSSDMPLEELVRVVDSIPQL